MYSPWLFQVLRNAAADTPALQAPARLLCVPHRPSTGTLLPARQFVTTPLRSVARLSFTLPESALLLRRFITRSQRQFIARRSINRITAGHRTGRIDSTTRRYPYAFYPGAVYVGYSGMLGDSYDDYDTPQQPAPEPGYDYNGPPDYSNVSTQPAPPADDSYAYPQAAAPPPPGYSYAYPQPMPQYAQPAPTPPQMQYVPGSADKVTLIYKDGRPPEQIQNYLATRTTLTVLDNGRRREVALADLDLPATMKANRETGVGFELPSPAH